MDSSDNSWETEEEDIAGDQTDDFRKIFINEKVNMVKPKYIPKKTSMKSRAVQSLTKSPKYTEVTQQLHCAIQQEDLKQVHHLVKAPNVDINAKVNNVTALGQAVNKQNIAIVKTLLDANANVNTATEFEQENGRRTKGPPVHAAAHLRNVEIVDLLLSYTQKTSIKDSRHNGLRSTALFDAVDWGNECLVKVLLHEGADNIIYYEYDSVTAVHKACSLGWVDILRLLLNARNPDLLLADDYGKTPLCHAAQSDEVIVLKELIPYMKRDKHIHYTVLQQELDDALRTAVTEESVSSCRYLLDQGASPDILIDKYKGPILYYICWDGMEMRSSSKRNIVTMLVQNNVQLGILDATDFLELVDEEVHLLHLLFYYGCDAMEPQWQVNDIKVPNYSFSDKAFNYLTKLLRMGIGSMVHDQDLRQLYKYFFRYVNKDSVKKPHRNDPVDLSGHLLSHVPSLLGLSRSCIRKSLANVSKFRSIVPLIKKLDIPHKLMNLLLLTDVLKGISCGICKKE